MKPRASTHRAERKRATVLFADIVGFTRLAERSSTERAYLAVTECLKLLDGVARKRGGSVDKYLGDCLMAVFGHPVPVRDDAGAAVEAALEMLQLLEETVVHLGLEAPLELHIGVNTGPLVAGDLRGRAIREFHVLGDAVNVAARLKQRAPLGRIYVGEQTYAETADRFDFEPLEPMQLKGKEARVATYELIGSRGAERRVADHFALAELVGRERELGQLRETLERLQAGHGDVVHLVGEAGSGKSRLVAALRALPAADGCADTTPDRVARKAGEDTGVRWIAGESLSGPEALEADAGGGPVAVVFEDLQRADRQALSRLDTLLPVAAGHPVLFLLLSRPGESETLDAWRARLGPSDAREIQLGPLDDVESQALIARLSGGPELSEQARRLVLERAAGNPLRIVQGVFLAPALGSEGERSAQDRSNEAERRRATVLFADITGFTSLTESLGDEEAYAVVADSLQLLDDVARRHGGTVDKYLGDCVLALFGVPEAIEDAPRAAINAAIEMRQCMQEFNRERALAVTLDVHSGINTGLGISGDISGPLLREFAVLGEPVVVADLLKDLAPSGEIYLGAETWRLTEEVFETEPVDPVELPGSETRVAARRLLSRQPQLYRRRVGVPREIFSDLVGREAEITRLRERTLSLADGRGGIVSVVGEAGLGKSRLVAELLGSEAAGQTTCLEGRALSVGQQLSFHPFADLLRAWAGMIDEDAVEELIRKLAESVERLFPGEVDEIAPLLATLMGLPLSQSWGARIEAIPDDMLERVLRQNVTRVLQEESERRALVLVFDDLHWADLSSLELLQSLLRLSTSHPILFVHVFRPGFAETSEPLLAKVRSEYADQHSEIQLEPLRGEDSRLLINNLFRHADIPHAVRALIVEKARGNPFYVEEVVRSLIEQGAVEAHEDGFRATERIHEVEIPGTVQEVVMARVDRLDLHRKQILQLASVVGRSFHLEVLAEALPEDPELERHLEELVAAQFLVPWDRLQGVEFAFKHPLLHEVTYDSLLMARREQLHLQVGEAIERSLGETIPGYHAMLAYHFSLGRDLERAEQSLFRAGDEASRSSASNEALHFFRQASSLYVEIHPDGGDPQKRALLEKNIALALYNRGQFEEALEHFDLALEQLGQWVPRDGAVLQARFLWDLLGVLARLYAPLPGSRPAATPHQSEVIHVMFRRGLAQTTAAPTRFVYDSMAMIRALSKVDPMTVAESGGMYSGAVGIFSYGGVSFALGHRFLELARQVIDAGGSPELRLYFRFLNFLHHFLVGDWSREREIDPEDLEQNLRDGRLFEVTTYLGMLSEKRMREGRFGDAREWMEQIDKIWETYEYDPARNNHFGLPIFLALEQRRLADACNAADVYYEENPQDMLHLLALGYKAHAQVLGGELDDAEATLAKAQELVPRLGRPIPYHHSSLTTAQLAFDVARLEREGGRSRAGREAARKSARRAQAVASRVAFRRPEVLRLEGRRHWLLGARRNLGAGLSAEAHREEARRLFVELALDWDLERLDASTPP
jgi:class 3 adenylate cyclase/tetratricopeptide (TPR) repeat protein/ABC-type cobalamin/Fe3+-siderophores transport system ATPase subunit